MSSDKQINNLTNIPEDENGTRSLAPLLPKEFWQAEANRPTQSTWIRQVSKFLSHPFVLLALGGLLTSLLFPYISSKWQDHQKELDVKTELTTQITNSVSSVLDKETDIQLGILPHQIQGGPYDDFLNTVNDWSRNSHQVAAKLAAYYPKSDLTDKWGIFSVSLYFLAQLSLSNNRDLRISWIFSIKQSFLPNSGFACPSNSHCVLDDLQTATLLPHGDGLLQMNYTAYADAGNGLFEEMSNIVTEVISTPISLYSCFWCP